MGARTLRHACILAAGLAALSLALPQAKATVVEASGTLAKRAVGTSGPATVTVVWRVVRQAIDLPDPGTVSSPRLRILIDGTVVADLPRPLAQALPGETVSETATIRETVQFPAALVFRAVKQGSALQLTRAFADSPRDIPAVAELSVTPSGPASAALTVDRIALTFDDDRRTRVLAKGSALQAVVELSTDGVGRLSGLWEVATAATSAGTPVFRALSLVRQGVAGGGRTVITSPRLPTAEEGTSFVRFRVTDPALTVDTPVLQYYVTPRAPGGAPALSSMLVIAAPEPGDSLTQATRFAWSAVPGAEAYQLTFYATPAGPAAPLDPAEAPQAGAAGAEDPAGAPLAGLFVAGDRSEAVPAAFTLAQLRGGRSYLWQVLAIGANGAVIGSSSTREIYKP